MTARKIVFAAAVVLALAATASAAVAFHSNSRTQLDGARVATAQYRHVANAVLAGYGEFRDAQNIACIELAGEGGMGIHYVNGALVGDDVLDAQRPEALVYQPHGKKLDLVALEYIVFASAWTKTAPPELFGRTFDYVPAGNRYGLPPFWALHAWVFKHNPMGVVMAWNPRVSC
ncbi:MAG TPA: hypothetical protein VIZ29_06260 [Gaiellaceae bacterium]